MAAFHRYMLTWINLWLESARSSTLSFQKITKNLYNLQAGQFQFSRLCSRSNRVDIFISCLRDDRPGRSVKKVKILICNVTTRIEIKYRSRRGKLFALLLLPSIGDLDKLKMRNLLAGLTIAGQHFIMICTERRAERSSRRCIVLAWVMWVKRFSIEPRAYFQTTKWCTYVHSEEFPVKVFLKIKEKFSTNHLI